MKNQEKASKNLFLINEFLGFENLAKSVSGLIPFSKIVVYAKEKDYFSYGTNLIDNLKAVNLKPILIIIKDNSIFNTLDSIFDYTLIEDVRGIIITDKSLLPLILNAQENVQIFCLIFDAEFFGSFNSVYFVDKGKIENHKVKNDLHYYIDYKTIIKNQKQKLIMQLLVIIVCLMDLVNYKTNFLIEEAFYNKLKSLSIDIYLLLKQKKENYIKIVNKFIALNSAIFKHNILFSANLFSYSIKEDFFALDYGYIISKTINNYYRQLCLEKVSEKNDEIDNLKGLAFITKLDFSFLLKQIKEQNKIHYDISELKNLTLLYKDCVSLIDKEQDFKLEKFSDLAKDYFEFIRYCPVIKI